MLKWYYYGKAPYCFGACGYTSSLCCEKCLCLLQFGEEVTSLCSELCVSVFRRELSRVCQLHHGGTDRMRDTCRHFSDLSADAAANLAQICRALSRLYSRNPQMRLVSHISWV